MSCGFYTIDKPAGITSRRVVDVVAKLVRPARAGHAGTLDPLATGVLVVAVGRATRLIPHVQAGPKVYRARFLLGRRSETDDTSGNIELVDPQPAITLEALATAVKSFVGRIAQVPPRFSAVKVGGRRAYDLARAGKDFTLSPRVVEVHSIEITSWDSPELELEIHCGSGTYVRSIGRDLGIRLGCGGVMSGLIRTRVGPFTLETATILEDLHPESLQAPLLAVAELPRQPLGAEEIVAIGHGQRVSWKGESLEDRCEVVLVDSLGQLVALGEFRAETNQCAPRLVFLDSEPG
ncbi:MAG: tRNA pseudouridine(55) synthase TruB [Planctomycetaceae bacterium]